MDTREQPRTAVPIPVWSDPGLRFGAGHGVLIALLLLAGLCRIGEVATEAVVVVAMAVVASGLPLLLRPAIALVAWAFVTGFVVNQFGELTFAASDLQRMLVLLGAITFLGTAPRWWR